MDPTSNAAVQTMIANKFYESAFLRSDMEKATKCCGFCAIGSKLRSTVEDLFAKKRIPEVVSVLNLLNCECKDSKDQRVFCAPYVARAVIELKSVPESLINNKTLCTLLVLVANFEANHSNFWSTIWKGQVLKKLMV